MFAMDQTIFAIRDESSAYFAKMCLMSWILVDVYI